MQLIASSPFDLPAIADDICLHYPDIKIFLLKGELGSGKTTFVKAFCKVMEVKLEVSSPTFAIIHEYKGREDVYHFDLYRLKHTAELMEIGFDEYLSYSGYKLIEWPDIAEQLLDEDYLTIYFTATSDTERKLEIIKTIKR